MKINITRTQAVVAFVASLSILPISASAQETFFEDSFDTDSSANWTLLEASLNGIQDFSAEFGRDYTQDAYSLTRTDDNGEESVESLNVPPNPFSQGDSTLGLKIRVNTDNEASEAGVSLYPNNLDVSGNFALMFEMFISYNGPAFGGSGSTEFALMGINHTGTLNSWLDGNLAVDGDGVFFAVSGEGGASRDYRAYTGDGFEAPASLDEFNGGFLDRNNDFTGDINNFVDSPYVQVFPAPSETLGSPGKQWVRVEVRQVDGLVTWLLNGFIIAEHADIFSPNGTVMIGYSDPFSSIANPGEENYIIFDNLRVISLDGVTPAPVVGATSPGNIELDEFGLEVFVPNSMSEDGGTGLFTLTRTGSTDAALEVSYTVSGEATPGDDYEALPGSVTIPAGSDTATITVNAINDTQGEDTENVTLLIKGSAEYEIREQVAASIPIADDGDVAFASVEAVRPSTYERIPDESGLFSIQISSPTATGLTVDFDITGNAQSDVDYFFVVNSVFILPGETSADVIIVPMDNDRLDGTRSVTITLKEGIGYEFGDSIEATVEIRDDETADAVELFSDDMNSTDASDWIVLNSSGDGVEDFTAEFGFDYGFSIPPAPNSTDGSTRGLRLTANKNNSDRSASAVNVLPANVTFSGNYAVRFDMFISLDTGAAGTTEHSIMGINHSGTAMNRHGAAGGDGLWFAVNGDGSNNRIFASYTNPDPTEAPEVSAKVPEDLGFLFPAPPYISSNSPAGVWVDVEIRQVGSTVTWSINQAVLFEISNNGVSKGTFMLGQNDQFSSVGSLDNFVIYDNVRVVELEGPSGATEATLSGITVNAGSIEMGFGASTGAASDFTLESTGALTAPISWGSVDGAVIEETGAGEFSAKTQVPGTARQYYRIRSN